MNTIEQYWLEFTQCIPNDASPTQYTEMRRAFYAGATVVLGLSTSAMDMSDMSELIEYMYAWGTDEGVMWSNDS